VINWLKGLFGKAFSGLDDLYHYVLSLFQYVYSYIDAYVQSVWQGVLDAWNYIQWVYNTAISYAVQLYNMIRYVIDVEINAVEQWVSSLFSAAYDYIRGIINWVQSLINQIEAWIGQELQGLANWVLNSIWSPLYNYISGVVDWVTKYGYWVYYILTHPDELAKILGRYILGSIFNLGRQYSRVVARWLIHSTLSAGHEIGDILDTVISSLM